MGRSEKRVVFFSLLLTLLHCRPLLRLVKWTLHDLMFQLWSSSLFNSPGALRPCLFCTPGTRTPGKSKRLRMRKLFRVITLEVRRKKQANTEFR